MAKAPSIPLGKEEKVELPILEGGPSRHVLRAAGVASLNPSTSAAASGDYLSTVFVQLPHHIASAPSFHGVVIIKDSYLPPLYLIVPAGQTSLPMNSMVWK